MQSASDIFSSRLSIEEAKRRICLLFYSNLVSVSIQTINDIFYPKLARWAIANKKGNTALGVIRNTFQGFDPHAQQREAEILNQYLIQLGSN